jgi:hypothetical protein
MSEPIPIPPVAEKQPSLLRALIEIRGGELCVYPLCDNDLDERRIFDALRFVRQDTD